jgi:hypothetical protein
MKKPEFAKGFLSLLPSVEASGGICTWGRIVRENTRCPVKF